MIEEHLLDTHDSAFLLKRFFTDLPKMKESEEDDYDSVMLDLVGYLIYPLVMNCTVHMYTQVSAWHDCELHSRIHFMAND